MNLQSIKQRFGIVGRSAELDRALGTAARVAPTDLAVLITGPSGVGKEAFSKIIHALSPRKHNKFIAINCGAMPAGTINSELFGHDKGAFTGATSDRKGYFETVNGGTIFLDEIGEMPLDTQAYLLRVLEQGEFIRVGSSSVQTTDVRVVAATNKDLHKRIRDGKFREDLYYRLSTVPIDVPALNERPEDINMLFRKFSRDFEEKYNTPAIKLTPQATKLFEGYGWPGNVRELKNVVEQMSILSEKRELDIEDVATFLQDAGRRNLPIPATSAAEGGSMAEREILYKLLFDMKQDLNDLKGLVFGLISNNDLSVPDNPSGFTQLPPTGFVPDERSAFMRPEQPAQPSYNTAEIAMPSTRNYDEVEEVEDRLSIEDMEKDLITRALKKHKGRRRDAAAELGISERTLYRKIKYYHIDE